MRSLLFAVTCGALAIVAVPANAVTIGINQTGASGTTSLQGFVDVGNTATSISGLTGTLGLTYTSGAFNAGTNTTAYNFNYTVANTSSGNTTSSAIGSFGLNTTPNLTNATSTGLYNLALLNPSFPNVNGANVIEACFSAGNNSCNANGTVLTPGQTTSGTLSLIFAGNVSSISLDGAYLRFQGVDSTSPNLNGASGVGFNSNVQITPFSAVPGPIVGAGAPGLVAACIALCGLHRRRRKLAV